MNRHVLIVIEYESSTSGKVRHISMIITLGPDEHLDPARLFEIQKDTRGHVVNVVVLP